MPRSRIVCVWRGALIRPLSIMRRILPIRVCRPRIVRLLVVCRLMPGTLRRNVSYRVPMGNGLILLLCAVYRYARMHTTLITHLDSIYVRNHAQMELIIDSGIIRQRAA